MTCKNGSNCAFDSKIHRPVRLSRDRIRYAELWAEVELPKLLGEKKQ